MDTNKWRTKITRQCKAVGTYKPAFAPVIETLAQVLSQRDGTREEFEKIFAEKSGFVKAMWCGDRACEEAIKENMAVTSRCMPFHQECLSDKCVYCGKPAKKMVYWGRAY